MSVKNELLDAAFMIYEQHRNRGWDVRNSSGMVQMPEKSWQALDGSLLLENVTFAAGDPPEYPRIAVTGGSFIVAVAGLGEESITVHKDQPDKIFEDPYFEQTFLEPFKRYPREHLHSLCIRSIAERRRMAYHA